MKKMAKLFLVFLLAVSLAGCVKYNVSMEVKDDKSVTLEVIYGMEISEDMMEGETDSDEGSSDVDADDYKFLEEAGYTVEEFEENKEGTVLSGVKLSKTFNNIDEITASEKIVVDFNVLFSEGDINKIRDAKFFYKDGDNYVANFVFDFLEGADDAEREEYAANDSMFTDLIYKIKLSNKSVANNATTVSEDGKELTWNLSYSKYNEVNFSFVPVNNNSVVGDDNKEPIGDDKESGKATKDNEKENNLLPIIIAVVAGVAVIGGVVAVVVISKKKKNNNNNGMNAAPVMPEVQPMAKPQPVENVPTMETTPVVENVQPLEAAPAVEETPVAEEVPAVETAPVVEETPVAEEVSTEETAPAVEETKNTDAPTDNV